MKSENIRENSEATLSYKDLIRESTFLGETPFDVIIENIISQFDDYIDLKDKTNYVELFYNQWDYSWETVIVSDSEDHPVEKKEILHELYDTFIEVMTTLFDERLAISLNDSFIQVESHESQNIITMLYEFFILHAKRNFRNVFARSILEYIGPGVKADSDEFFDKANDRLRELEGIITDIHTRDFLEWSDSSGSILSLFENEDVFGNFLRRYSARLYANEEFSVEIITYVTMYVANKEDIRLLWGD